jgi:hypothetical protein
MPTTAGIDTRVEPGSHQKRPPPNLLLRRGGPNGTGRDLRVEDFEPPTGTQRLEEFLDHQWGDSAPRTYNKGLSIVRDFFRWHIPRGKLHGDPTLLIERAKRAAKSTEPPSPQISAA